MNMIRSSLTQLERFEVSRRFYDSIKTQVAWSSLSRSAVENAFFDTFYVLLRHRMWVGLKTFKEFVIEMLQHDHNLPRESAASFYDLMVEDMRDLKILKSLRTDIDERDFLTYAYANAAACTSEEDLLRDIGLGSIFLRRLRDGIRVVASGAKDKFVTEFDAELATIMIELSYEARSIPWAVDVRRLKYTLLEHNSFDEGQVEDLFQTLCQIAEHQLGLSSEININESSLKMLLSCDLIYGGDRKSKIKMSEIAWSLVAHFITSTHEERLKQDPQTIVSLPQALQRIVIQKINKSEVLTSLLQDHIAVMSPQAITCLLNQSRINLSEDELKVAFNKIEFATLTPWQRHVVEVFDASTYQTTV
jgi:hypothetical protein